MKRLHKTVISSVVLSLMTLVVLLSGCIPKQVENAKPRSDVAELRLYLKDKSTIKSVDYEQVYISYVILGAEMGLSPSDPEYRGVIYLKEEAGKEFFDAHNWKEDTSTLPEFTCVDTKPLNSETWYEYDDTNFDFFDTAMVFVNYFRFNGKDKIVFDIQTH